MLQNSTVAAFTVFELIRENQLGGKITVVWVRAIAIARCSLTGLLNGWVFVHEPSGFGFQSRYSHLKTFSFCITQNISTLI